jgi:hypothetical protein
MKESYEKDLASHLGLESYAGDGNIPGVASVRGTDRPAIELRNQNFRVLTLWWLWKATRDIALRQVVSRHGGVVEPEHV